MDIREKIRIRTSEAFKCFEEYMKAVQIADGNREATRLARQSLLSRNLVRVQTLRN